MNGTTGNQVLNTINVGPLGAWWTLKNAPDSVIAINALSGLLYGLRDSIQPSLYASFLFTINNFDDEAKTIATLNSKGVFGEQANAIYTDKIHGWSSNLTLDTWVQATIDGLDRGASVLLQNYF